MTTVGCDPEFVVLDPKGNPVPAHKFFNTKDKVGMSRNGAMATSSIPGKVFRDGFNIEVNVEGQYCRALMNNAIRDTLKNKALTVLPPGYTLDARAAYKINPRTQLADSPDDVKHFGCDPSYDAYANGAAKVITIDASVHPWRYAGGHLHFGIEISSYTREHVLRHTEKYPEIVQVMDKYIGLPLAVIFNDPAQWRRRKLYGQAGEFRPQKYGVQAMGLEYRVPPPQLFNHPALVTLFSGIGREIVDFWKGRWVQKMSPAEQTALVRAINTGKGAEKLLASIGDCEGWYTVETIMKLRDMEEVHTFQMDKFTFDAHTGWTEFAEKHALKGPREDEW